MSNSIITNAGITASINASTTGPQIRVSYFKIGSQIISLDASITDVVGEVYSSKNTSNKISYSIVDVDTVQYEIILDESVGPFLVGNIGLYLDDNTLFAIMGLVSAETKTATVGETAGNRKQFTFTLKLGNQATITDFSLVVNNYTNLPEVATEAGLPVASIPPTIHTYMVNNHTQYGSPAIAHWVNSTWTFAPLRSITDDGETLWLNKLENRAVVRNDIVHSFLYFTNTDSYNGRWRYATKHTSWYNEPLQTLGPNSVVVRGSKAMFPSQVAIVAYPNEVQIFDLSNNTLPLWMGIRKEAGGAGLIKTGYSVSCVHAAEGCVYIGFTNDNNSLQGYMLVLDFVLDMVRLHDSTGGYKLNINIAQRHQATISASKFFSGGALGNGQVRTVGAHAMSGFGVDPIIGRTEPVVAVGHDTGLTVLVGPDTSYNSNDNGRIGEVRVSKNQISYVRKNSSLLLVQDGIPSENPFTPSRSYSDTTDVMLADSSYTGSHRLLTANGINYVGIANILSLVQDTAAPMSLNTTSLYTTGWLNPKTVACWFANHRTEDRSAKKHTLTAANTLSLSAAATGAELNMVQGFNAVTYVSHTNHADFGFGTTNFSISFWVKTSASAAQTLYEYAQYTSAYIGSGIRIKLDSSNFVTFTITNNGFSTTDSVTSNRIIPNNKATLVTCQRVGSKLEMWIDGIKSASGNVTAASSTLTNSSAALRIGNDFAAATPALYCSLALLRVSKKEIDASNHMRMFEDEKHLFETSAKCLLPSALTDIRGITKDEFNNDLMIASDSGTVVFQGLRRTNILNDSSVILLSSDNHTSVSAAGFACIIATANELYFARPATTLNDFTAAMIQYSQNSSNTTNENNITTEIGNVPIGAVLIWPAAIPPNENYVLAYGQNLSRVDFPVLFDRYGTANGAGDGVNTFGLPDMRGRAPFGKDNMGGTAANRITSGISGINGTQLGASGGSEAMQQHSHTITDPGHSHGAWVRQTSGGELISYFTGSTTILGSGTTASSTTGITVNNTGVGSSQNMPPAYIVNFIIRIL